MGAGAAGAGYGGANFSDIFGDVFSDFSVAAAAALRRRSVARSALHARTRSRRAVRGTTVTIRVPTPSSARPAMARAKKHQPVTCTTCGGIGQCACSRAFLGAADLSRCHGSGKMISIRAAKPPRAGAREEQKTPRSRCRRVSIPVIAFVCLAKARRASGWPGEICMVVNVREHAIFQRDGKHLYCGAYQLC